MESSGVSTKVNSSVLGGKNYKEDKFFQVESDDQELDYQSHTKKGQNPKREYLEDENEDEEIKRLKQQKLEQGTKMAQQFIQGGDEKKDEKQEVEEGDEEKKKKQEEEEKKKKKEEEEKKQQDLLKKLDELDENFAKYKIPNCKEKGHEEETVVMVCLNSQSEYYMNPICLDCLTTKQGHATSLCKKTSLFLKEIFNLTKNSFTSQFEWKENKTVKLFLEVLDRLDIITKQVGELKKEIDDKLKELFPVASLKGSILSDQEFMVQKLEHLLQNQDYDSLKQNLTEIAQKIVVNPKDSSVNFKGQENTNLEKEQQEKEKFAKTEEYQKKVISCVRKIEDMIVESYQHTKMLDFQKEKPENPIDIQNKFSNFKKMAWGDHSKKIIEIETGRIFQGSNSFYGQYLGSVDPIPKTGKHYCQIQILQIKEGDHINLMVGFIKDSPNWISLYPGDQEGCQKCLFDPGMYYQGNMICIMNQSGYTNSDTLENCSMDPVLDDYDVITLIADMDDGCLRAFSPCGTIVYQGKFTKNQVKENQWRFIVGFGGSQHKIKFL